MGKTGAEKGKETWFHLFKLFFLPWQRNKQKEGKQQVNQQQLLQLTQSNGVAIQSEAKTRGSLMLWLSAFWLCTAISILLRGTD